VRPARGRSDSTGDIMAYPVETTPIVNAVPFERRAQTCRSDHGIYVSFRLSGCFPAERICSSLYSRASSDPGHRTTAATSRRYGPESLHCSTTSSNRANGRCHRARAELQSTAQSRFRRCSSRSSLCLSRRYRSTPSFAFGGPQVHTPGPPLRQENPSPQGAGKLKPRFHSPAAVTPAGATFHSPAYAPIPREPPPSNTDPWTSIYTVKLEGRGDWSFHERADGATLVLRHNGVGDHERDPRAEGGVVEQTSRRVDRYLASLYKIIRTRCQRHRPHSQTRQLRASPGSTTTCETPETRSLHS
jgi:hypothetical protein